MGTILAIVVWLFAIGLAAGLLITTGVIIAYSLKRLRR